MREKRFTNRVGILLALVWVAIAIIAFPSNKAHADGFSDMLQIYSEAKRANILCGVVNSSGYPCSRVTVTFYKGVDKDNAGYWDVSCTNGTNYVIQISDNSRGTTTVMPCELMERLTGTKCFEKF